MLSCTPLTVIVIYYQTPRLVPALESLGYSGDRVLMRSVVLFMLPVECNVDIAPFVIHSLQDTIGQQDCMRSAEMARTVMTEI